MANLQVKGMEDALYSQLKNLAQSENRSISQQVIFLLKRYLATKQELERTELPAKVLLELAGSWEDKRLPKEIVRELKAARKRSRKLMKGF